jgi:Flp pilus assembly protein TadD
MAKLWRRHLKMGALPQDVTIKGAETRKFPTAETYFERAMRFAPDDGTVRLVYGIHLHKLGKLDQALELYEEAEKLQPNSAEVHYNLGLLYVAKENYRLAKIHAQRAYQLGHPLPGLRNKLVAAGVWMKGTAR